MSRPTSIPMSIIRGPVSIKGIYYLYTVPCPMSIPHLPHLTHLPHQKREGQRCEVQRCVCFEIRERVIGVLPQPLIIAFSVVSQKAPFIGDGLFEVGQFLFVAYSRVCTVKGAMSPYATSVRFKRSKRPSLAEVNKNAGRCLLRKGSRILNLPAMSLLFPK